MRAPPEALKMMAGTRLASARSNSRVIFSPTTEPIEPPMNSKTNTPKRHRQPLDGGHALAEGVGGADLLLRRAQAIGVALGDP